MRTLRLVSLMLVLSLSLLAAESPFSGTWKLNLEKSKMTPPYPKEVIVRVDADDNGIKVKEDVIDTQGQATIECCINNAIICNNRCSGAEHLCPD